MGMGELKGSQQVLSFHNGPGVVWGVSGVFSESPKKPARGVTIPLLEMHKLNLREGKALGEGTLQGRMDYKQQSQGARCPTANLSASLRRYFIIIVWSIQTRSERGGERGALLGGSAIAKKDNKVLSHLGGQRQRFQEESLLGTSVK